MEKHVQEVVESTTPEGKKPRKMKKKKSGPNFFFFLRIRRKRNSKNLLPGYGFRLEIGRQGTTDFTTERGGRRRRRMEHRPRAQGPHRLEPHNYRLKKFNGIAHPVRNKKRRFRL